MIARRASSVRLVSGVVAFVFVSIAASILFVPAGKDPAYHFADEAGAITVLSALFLAVAGGFAGVAYLIATDVSRRRRAFWWTLALALGFLALDELLQFHDRAGARLQQVETLRSMVEKTPVRSWNDLIVILYGAVALIWVGTFRSSIFARKRLRLHFAVAWLFYLVHTGIDSFVEPPTTLSYVLEESAKLSCSAFLALAVLFGLLDEVSRNRSVDGDRTGLPPIPQSRA